MRRAAAMVVEAAPAPRALKQSEWSRAGRRRRRRLPHPKPCRPWRHPGWWCASGGSRVPAPACFSRLRRRRGRDDGDIGRSEPEARGEGERGQAEGHAAVDGGVGAPGAPAETVGEICATPITLPHRAGPQRGGWCQGRHCRRCGTAPLRRCSGKPRRPRRRREQ